MMINFAQNGLEGHVHFLVENSKISKYMHNGHLETQEKANSSENIKLTKNVT